MRIDETGEYEPPRGVDDFAARRGVEVRPDAADGFIFDEDVAARAGLRRDVSPF